MNRAENFNAQIFNKRLDVFSELYATWNRTYKDVSDFIESIISQTISEDTDLFEVQFILGQHKQVSQPLFESYYFFSREEKILPGNSAPVILWFMRRNFCGG